MESASTLSDVFFTLASKTDTEESTTTFALDLKASKSFKGGFWAEEKTFRILPLEGRENLFLNNVLQSLYEMFSKLMKEIKKQYDSHDISRMFISHPKLEKPIIVTPRPVSEMTPTTILDQIEFVLSSSAKIPLDEDLDINVAVVRKLSGQGDTRTGCCRLEHSQDRRVKSSVVRVPTEVTKENSKYWCLPRAVVIGNRYVLAEREIQLTGAGRKQRQRLLSKAYRSASKKNVKQLDRDVEDLMFKCNVAPDRAGIIPEDVMSYECHLKISICVFSRELQDQVIYPGNNDYRKRGKIYLFHWKPPGSSVWHFDLIRSMAAFMEKTNYCYDCEKAFNNPQIHSCFNFCSVCNSKKCPLKGESFTVECSECNRTCRSQECFQRHKKAKKLESTRKRKRSDLLANSKEEEKSQEQTGKILSNSSLCFQKYKCLKCSKVMREERRSRKHHRCGEIFCNNCQTWNSNTDETSPHRCHMRSVCSKTLTQINKVIYYDFEASQENGTHVPNLVVAQSSCSTCEENDETDMCSDCGTRCSKCDSWNDKEKQFERSPCDNKSCGAREVIFRGNDVTREFGQWLISRQHKNTTVVAHNAKSYDNFFILQYLLEAKITPYVIFSGSKACYMKIARGLNIRFLDSCMFLPMALSELPSCFDIHNVEKGFFPHFFNVPGNFHKVFSKLPDRKFYGYETMTAEKRDKFDQWYGKHVNDKFDFEEELLRYCRNDVEILRKACTRYRNKTKEVTAKGEVPGIDPFSFVSAASVSLGIFRARHLEENWSVLRKSDVKELNCSHDEDTCNCSWRPAIKKHGDAEVEELNSGFVFSSANDPIIQKKFMRSNVALIPPSEYRPRDNHSKECLMWLKEEEEKVNCDLQSLGYNPITIQTATSSLEGEKKIFFPATASSSAVTYKVDGFYVDPVTGWKVVLEFYGCHWHGCPTCFHSDSTVISHSRKQYVSERGKKLSYESKTMEQRYKETLCREERIRSAGFLVKTMWNCQFNVSKIADTSTEESFKGINLRDAYFGGRTAALTYWHVFTPEEGEVGKYVDFTSLYPWALKYGTFPVSHPRKIVGKEIQNFLSESGDIFVLVPCKGEHFTSKTRHCSLSSHFHHYLKVFGIIKVTVIPPRNLFHPVLAYRCGDNKLVFPLCVKCAEQNSQGRSCQCSDEDRSWTGTFTTPELEAALDVGYRIQKIFEILHWDESSSDIFSSYVNTFLQIKQEASGFPTDVISPEDKKKFQQKYLEKEDILLNLEKVKKSSTLRSLAKLMLNSLYGKFGQRINLRKSHFVDNPTDLCKIVSSPKSLIKNFHVLSDDIMHLETVDTINFTEQDLKSNVIISIFTTAWARLKLWTVMMQLGERVLYTDTDSLIYVSRPFLPDLPTGEFLGDLADELSCKKLNCKRITSFNSKFPSPCHYITEFVAGGPKNYAYQVNSGETVCKIRGFTLNCCTAEKLNFHSLKNQVLSMFSTFNEEKKRKSSDVKVTVQSNQIVRKKENFSLVNRQMEKRYGVVLDKTFLLPNFTSVPFGYFYKQE